jgi:hypothetical protein
VAGLWGREKINWSGQESVHDTASNWFKITRSMMHNSQRWIWPNQRECLFYEKTVITSRNSSFLIIHYGLTCKNRAHAAILGQDCTAFFRTICPREKKPCMSSSLQAEVTAVPQAFDSYIKF